MIELAQQNKEVSTPDDFFTYALEHGFGDLHVKVDPKTGMRAIIAVHNTKLGPALGGCRFIEYTSTNSALYDAMRLARGMSYKSALAGLPLGGGKSVVIKPQGAFDREAYFHAFGAFVNELNGRYITALDSGTTLEDMDIIAEHTPFVASLSADAGDPSPYTANGVLEGIRAAVLYQLDKESLSGLHIAIQGLGHVGFALATHLHNEGARLTVADINDAYTAAAVKQFGATVVPTERIHAVPCDVFAPCALGAIINDSTINALQTTIIAGAANNQLAHRYHGEILRQKKILYAPDYVINAGGVIFAAAKYLKTPDAIMHQQIDSIGLSLTRIFERAEREDRASSDIADILAEEIIA